MIKIIKKNVGLIIALLIYIHIAIEMFNAYIRVKVQRT